MWTWKEHTVAGSPGAASPCLLGSNGLEKCPSQRVMKNVFVLKRFFSKRDKSEGQDLTRGHKFLSFVLSNLKMLDLINFSSILLIPVNT